MRVPLPLVALAVVVLASVPASIGAPPGPPVTRTFAWDVTAVACPSVGGDGVCLAYDGQIPGPTLDINLGDTVVLTLTNRIAETLPVGAPAFLATSPVSFHVHGTAVSAAKDGVMAHAGTQLVESVAHPGGSFTYTFRAAFAGTWHYHDHVLGIDGAEGTARGLYGALLVRNGAEARPDRVVDVHVHDDAINLGASGPTAAIGEDLDIVVVGLGSRVWAVTVKDPAGATLATLRLGPGVSERVHVADADAGAYVVRAQWGPFVRTLEVTVS